MNTNFLQSLTDEELLRDVEQAAGQERGATVQDLLRHVVPNGDVAEILDRALTLLLRDVERRRVAKVDRPRAVCAARADSRHVPASIRREVWARDEGRCAFVGTKGRCQEGFLEFHHVIPFADGGETTEANLQLRCRAHNDHEAREWFDMSRVEPLVNRRRARLFSSDPGRKPSFQRREREQCDESQAIRTP